MEIARTLVTATVALMAIVGALAIAVSIKIIIQELKELKHGKG